ncbi:MAG: hypothetical protein KAS73_12350 [Candidatus Sabulitectum sp.]|nr:hypothetical protein [Candidatus Sabulitectum sp.]
MKPIAIHSRSGSFSDIWIEYCNKHRISFKTVNCYENNIYEQLKDCSGLMWHWSHDDYRAQNFTRQFIKSLELLDIKVFPNYDTAWHYDDKVGQKYLLEIINAPIIPSYVFYDYHEACRWIDTAEFPKVFKLRGGASSFNVALVRDKIRARKIAKRAFTKGFSSLAATSILKERIWDIRRDRNMRSFYHLLKSLVRVLFPNQGAMLLPRQKGYVYFQDFLPDINHDTRVYIVGNKAFATTRYSRHGDFRASGSGLKSYDHTLVDKEYLRLAFELSDKLGMQSCAYDFLKFQGKIFLLEISYCFGKRSLTGYWDRNLNWHEDLLYPEEAIIDDFVKIL